MLKGLGCDMIEVERIRQALSRPSFLRRVYTLEERAAIARKGAQTAAGFWAAKEAVSKALGTGFDGFALSRFFPMKRARRTFGCIAAHRLGWRKSAR